MGALLLDMWVIFVNISPVIGPVIHEERNAPACLSTIAPCLIHSHDSFVDLLSDWACRCLMTICGVPVGSLSAGHGDGGGL